MQVSRQCKLLTSQDPCVRRITEQALKNEETSVNKAFRPALEVREAMREDPGCNRQQLLKRVKARVKDADNEARVNSLLTQEKQGNMLRLSSPDAIDIWAGVVQSLPPDQQKFILNGTTDTLPHNANLHLWQKRSSPDCPLCGERQSLIHVLNCCPVAREFRRYNTRHDAVLGVIVQAIKEYLPQSCTLVADLGDGYSLPSHILQTDLRPDIVWWDSQSVVLVELTIAFDVCLSEAHERKEAKYCHLLDNAREHKFRASLITLEVGSRGVPHLPGFQSLQKALSLPVKPFKGLLRKVISAAIEGSFSVWVNRNKCN